MKDQIIKLTSSQHAIPSLDWIFKQPIFKSTDFVNQAGIPTARRILKCLLDSNICTTMMKARGQRAAVLAFPELLNLTEGEKVF